MPRGNAPTRLHGTTPNPQSSGAMKIARQPRIIASTSMNGEI